MHHSWQHTGVVHLSLRRDGRPKVAFEAIPVFGVGPICRSACHNSSLCFFVLVIFLEAVALFQEYVDYNMYIDMVEEVLRRMGTGR